MMSPPKVAVVVGSTRQARICPTIATWVAETAGHDSVLRYELLDLADVDLPFLDEPRPPAHGGSVHAHTRRWSALAGSYDAFAFVLPQYNWGYPAVLKNALDFLYDEWAAKPAGIVTYGNHGGGKAAIQLQQVLTGLHMRTAPEPVLLTVLLDAAESGDVAGELLPILAPSAAAVRDLDLALTTLLA
jgi:NAD(P)H-dependent FMN reductase